MPLSVGTRLGPYEILAPLGTGGMGEVWKARDTRLDRTVAVKVSQEQFSERFEREARAVAALNHPNICQLYDVGPNYLVMEYVEGAPIAPVDNPRKLLDLAVQIADGMAAAHAANIVHRDLKPDNILVTREGRVKILDFGLAKAATASVAADDQNATVSITVTDPGTVVGTVAYMSPEQARGNANVGAQSDQFSLGLILYELAAGKRAFQRASAAETMTAIMREDAEPLPPITPGPLRWIIERCLSKDSSERYDSTRDLYRELRHVRERLSEATTAVAGAVPQVRPRRATLLWLGGAALVVFSLGWAASYLRQPAAEERAVRAELDAPAGGQFLFGFNSGGISLSPDGRTTAFVATANGNIGLWVRPLDSAEARLLPGTEGAGHPFWSPDGKSLGFFAGTKLLRVDLAGGAPLALCDVSAGGRGGAWTEDGRIVFAANANSLFQVSASGGMPSRFTTLDRTHGILYHYWPQTLPGNKLLFFVRSSKPEYTGAYVAPLGNPAGAVRLFGSETNALFTEDRTGKGYLLWLRGGTLVTQEFDLGSLKLAGEPHPIADPVGSIGSPGRMNVAVSGNGTLIYDSLGSLSEFTWLDRAGNRLATVGEPGNYNTFRISPDGHRVVTGRDSGAATNLWLLEVDRGVFSVLTTQPVISWYPIWSPDGRAVVFSGGEIRDLVWKPVGSGSEQPLTKAPYVQLPADWSADGRFVLYIEIAAEDTQRDLWVLPMGSEGKQGDPKPYLRTKFNEYQGRFSPGPDPHWVAYTSDESGRLEVYIQSFPVPHGATRISTGGGQYPQWHPGGREIYYVSPNSKLMKVSLKLGTDSVEALAPVELFALPAGDSGVAPYDVAPDGQRFLVRAPPGQGSHPLTMILNWPALLKKGAAQ